MAGKISLETKKRVIDLHSEGRSKKAISEETGISVTSVSRIILEASTKKNTVNDIPGANPGTVPDRDTVKAEDREEKIGKNSRITNAGNSVAIPVDRLESLMNTILEALKENVQQSLETTISRFTPDNVRKFLTMLTDEDRARTEIESLKAEIARLNRVKESLDSEILDAVMRMSSIESRIISIEKRFGMRLQEESEEP